MIRFFRSLLPSRLLMLILFYLAIRVPLLLIGVPDTLPELRALLVGERMADGFALYRDIFVTMAPLAAIFYWLIDLVFGRAPLVHHGLAAALILFQGLRLNVIFMRNGVFPEKSMLPALLYVTLGSIFYELDLLSPVLIGTTFLVLALERLTSISKGTYNTQKLFKAGFMLGLAALSFLPLVFFLLIGVFAILFYASNTFRSLMLLLCGFAFPYVVLGTYYLYTGSLTEFLEYNLLGSWRFRLDLLLSPLDLAKLWAAPLLILLLSFFRLTSITMGLNYQSKFQQLMFLWLLVGMLVSFSSQVVSVVTLLVFLPAIAYFGVFYFQRKKWQWVGETVFLVVLLAVIVFRYSPALGLQAYVRLDASPLEVSPQPKHQVVQGAGILVLGQDMRYYAHNQAATPYMDWDLALRDFGSLEQYESVYRIYRLLAQERPAYIMDEVNLMPELQHKIPTIFGQYEQTERRGVYKRTD